LRLESIVMDNAGSKKRVINEDNEKVLYPSHQGLCQIWTTHKTSNTASEHSAIDEESCLPTCPSLHPQPPSPPSCVIQEGAVCVAGNTLGASSQQSKDQYAMEG